MNAIMQRAALFLDRDGTIIEDTGYLHDPEQVVLLPGAAEALRAAARRFRLYLFTNQSGIGRGFYDLAAAERCNARMVELLGLPSPGFAGICIAPEAPEQPQAYRKPSPRYILESVRADHLDPALCWMVGDRRSDLAAGLGAGIRAALVWPKEKPEPPELSRYRDEHAVPRFPSLRSCIATLLERFPTQGRICD